MKIEVTDTNQVSALFDYKLPSRIEAILDQDLIYEFYNHTNEVNIVVSRCVDQEDIDTFKVWAVETFNKPVIVF